MAEQGKRIQFLQDALSKLARSIKEVSKGLIDLEGSIARITGKTKEFAKAQQEAAQGLKDFGGDPNNSEYYQYWQEQMSKCKVVKVTQTIEEVTFK